MMEIKLYKVLLLHYLFFLFQSGGRLVQGLVFGGPICRGPNWQRAELSSSHPENACIFLVIGLGGLIKNT